VEFSSFLSTLYYDPVKSLSSNLFAKAAAIDLSSWFFGANAILVYVELHYLCLNQQFALVRRNTYCDMGEPFKSTPNCSRDRRYLPHILILWFCKKE
jgi:hypothetical protein